MKSIRSLLPLALVLLSMQVFAQNRGAEARATSPKDSALTQRTKAQRDRERELRHRPRATARELEAQALEERARDMAESATARFEAFAEYELEGRARLAEELAESAVAGIDFEGLHEGLEHLGEAFEHMDFSGLEALEGLAGLEGLAALEGLSALADIPPFPAIAPIPAIPPIGPLPPVSPMIAGGVWHNGWHDASQRYRQYLSEDEQTRLSALRSLLQNDEKLALPEVKSLMQDNNWAMRASVLEMLAHVDNREAVSILRETLQRETDNRVKRAAIRALAQRNEPEAREALRVLLQK